MKDNYVKVAVYHTPYVDAFVAGDQVPRRRVRGTAAVTTFVFPFRSSSREDASEAQHCAARCVDHLSRIFAPEQIRVSVWRSVGDLPVVWRADE